MSLLLFGLQVEQKTPEVAVQNEMTGRQNSISLKHPGSFPVQAGPLQFD